MMTQTPCRRASFPQIVNAARQFPFSGEGAPCFEIKIALTLFPQHLPRSGGDSRVKILAERMAAGEKAPQFRPFLAYGGLSTVFSTQI
ncbi:MAG TPA: hypothetical protein VN042_10495 [Asticcacaulis sp.]|nr:hypothetical protein [Asticcacaulis sp.]